MEKKTEKKSTRTSTERDDALLQCKNQQKKKHWESDNIFHQLYLHINRRVKRKLTVKLSFERLVARCSLLYLDSLIIIDRRVSSLFSDGFALLLISSFNILFFLSLSLPRSFCFLIVKRDQRIIKWQGFFSFLIVRICTFIRNLYMAEVRRSTRNPSPPPRQFPVLPNPIRLHPPPPSSSATLRRTQSLQVNNPSTSRTAQYQHPPHLNRPASQTKIFPTPIDSKYDPLTDLLTNPVTTNTHEQSYITSSLLNQQTSENLYAFPAQGRLINHEASVISSRMKWRSLFVDRRIWSHPTIGQWRWITSGLSR